MNLHMSSKSSYRWIALRFHFNSHFPR